MWRSAFVGHPGSGGRRYGIQDMARTTREDGPHPVDRHVGRRVSEKRITLGYNQSDLGRALGLTFQQIQKYEKGSNRISASKLWEMARFFKVDVSYFFEGLDLSRSGPAHGLAEEGAEGFQHDFPATRYTIEMARLAPGLPLRKQKLILEMMREMAGQTADDEG